MKASSGPDMFVVFYTSSVGGALALLLYSVTAGLVVLLTALTINLVVALVMAEQAQAKYRCRLAAKVATRPWSEAVVLADEDALIEARRARLADSLSRTVRDHYGPPTAPQRVVIERHERIEEAAS